MIKVAITGNIASGKSQGEKILLSKGLKVADTDKINNFILMTDLSAIKEIKETFSEDDILDENKNISKDKLGKIVFSAGLKKIKLESILHKRINEKIEMFYEANKDEKVVFVSVPLLFEANLESNYDKIIFISADEDIRLKRLINRNHYSEEYARIRINSQWKEIDKIKKSDYVIYNNTDFNTLRIQTDRVIKNLFNL